MSNEGFLSAGQVQKLTKLRRQQPDLKGLDTEKRQQKVDSFEHDLKTNKFKPTDVSKMSEGMKRIAEQGRERKRKRRQRQRVLTRALAP